MAKLTTEERKKLPKKEFALPGGRYPIDTRERGVNALARASQHATPEEHAEIRRKVCGKYSDLPSCQTKKYEDPFK